MSNSRRTVLCRSCRCAECNRLARVGDDFVVANAATIVHLAIGWNTGHLKVASFLRSERMTKWNEGLRIKEQLGAAANFSGGSALPLLNRV
jgi:enolase